MKHLYHKLYEDMYKIRRFENKAYELYTNRVISGFCHLYNGQEAIVVGVKQCLEDGDSTITSYRCHAHMIASNVSPRSVMAELAGKTTGCSKGKGGSMHMFSKENEFYGGHGIVGAQVPIGTGIAFANKYRDNKKICAIFMGDGAANQGQVFEAYNMAAIWKLPALFIIENNKYAMGTHISRVSVGPLYKRGEALGIPGYIIDGQDVVEIISKLPDIIKIVRSGQPILVEFDTYRYRGHSMSDPAKYRVEGLNKNEFESYKERDPFLILKKYISDSSIEDLTKEIEDRINTEMQVEIDAALSDPMASKEDLMSDVLL